MLCILSLVLGALWNAHVTVAARNRNGKVMQKHVVKQQAHTDEQALLPSNKGLDSFPLSISTKKLHKFATKHKKLGRFPIYATGYWRDNADEKEALEEASGEKINILSQDDEGQFEANSVLSMLRRCGLNTDSLTILTIGSGKGSSQWVLYDKGMVSSTAIASGYAPNPAQQHKADQELGTKDAAFDQLTAKKPDLIVAWGALWYIVKDKGGLADNFALDLRGGVAVDWPMAGALRTADEKMSFINGAADDVPFLVVRNIVLPDGQAWKAHWDIPSAKYIDLGSGKAARVDSATGRQEVAVQFDNTDLAAVSAVLEQVNV